MRKTGALIFAIMLTFVAVLASFAGCNRKATGTLFRSTASTSCPKNAAQISFGDGILPVNVYPCGVCSVKTSGDSPCYGVANASDGTLIVPAVYNSVNVVGRFVVAAGNLGMEYIFSVFDLKGNLLTGFDEVITLHDIGDGYFSVTKTDGTFAYAPDGTLLLSSSNLSSHCEFSHADSYLIAHDLASENWYVFHAKTETLIKAFYSSDAVTKSLCYMGGGNFTVFYTFSASADNYTAKIFENDAYSYFTQSVYSYSVSKDAFTKLPAEGFYYKAENAFSVGISGSLRASYSLKEGYCCVYEYALDGKTATGKMIYRIADKNFNTVATMPDGVPASLTCKDGYLCPQAQTRDLLIVNAKAKVTAHINDAEYLSKTFNDGVCVASKMVNGALKYGAVDVNGNTVIPFEYAYLTAFASGYAVAQSGGKIYRIDKQNTKTYLADKAQTPYYYDNFYEVFSDDKLGLAAFDGTALVPADYDGINYAVRCGEDLFVCMNKNGLDVLWHLW